MNIKEYLKKFNWLYAIYREIVILKDVRKGLWVWALRHFEENPPEHGSLRDYKKALHRQCVSFKEYQTYKFWQLNKSERAKYLSEKELKCIYRKIIDLNPSRWYNNKLMHHIKFQKYMRRKWLCPSVVPFETFCGFVKDTDCLIKPWNGSLGQGIFMIKKDDDVDLQQLYDKCRSECLFIEEKVKGCKELEEFHPQSLNTIRVMSISKDHKFDVIGSMFRMGAGDNVVDNGSAGGILAPIDLNTGCIIDVGRDKDGKMFVTHPDTGKTIKGFVIPYWDNVIAACKEMVTYVPETIIAGWDLCVLENGEIELIEVNAAPNIMGLQVSFGYGLCPRLQALGKEILGYDLKKLISVWSKPRINYVELMQYKKRSRDANQQLKEYIENSIKTI